LDTRNYSGWILDHQDRLGWGNEETARRARVSPTTVSNLISGKIREPHRKTIRKLAAAFEVEAPEDPRTPALFTLGWARRATDREFYLRVIEEEVTDRLVPLRDELARFLRRPFRRELARRNKRVFEGAGPEPEPGEDGPLRERLEALSSVIRRLDPPFARVRMSVEGNECRWLIPPDGWGRYRDRVDAFFEGEAYRDVDARDARDAADVPEEIFLHV
jgi:transcriptional regulator with XRE-family HTH domain